jgi:hypothetical protein
VTLEGDSPQVGWFPGSGPSSEQIRGPQTQRSTRADPAGPLPRAPQLPTLVATRGVGKLSTISLMRRVQARRLVPMAATTSGPIPVVCGPGRRGRADELLASARMSGTVATVTSVLGLKPAQDRTIGSDDATDPVGERHEDAATRLQGPYPSGRELLLQLGDHPALMSSLAS